MQHTKLRGERMNRIGSLLFFPALQRSIPSSGCTATHIYPRHPRVSSVHMTATKKKTKQSGQPVVTYATLRLIFKTIAAPDARQVFHFVWHIRNFTNLLRPMRCDVSSARESVPEACNFTLLKQLLRI